MVIRRKQILRYFVVNYNAGASIVLLLPFLIDDKMIGRATRYILCPQHGQSCCLRFVYQILLS